MTSDPILVIGAGGKTGRRVDERLRAAGIATRPVARSTTPAFDWTDRSGWRDVVAGCRAAYVSFQPDLSVEGSCDAIGELCRIAREAGLEHVVLLSGRGEPEAQAAERMLVSSGLEWTVVRASWFNQNFSEGYLLDAILAGEVALPSASIPEPFVDADDIADVAVAALTGAAARGRVYDVTGPRAFTPGEAIAEIARASGRAVEFRPISHAQFMDELRAAEVPEDMIGFLGILFDEVMDGRNVTTANGVEEALGRKPKDFSRFAAEAAAAGAWRG